MPSRADEQQELQQQQQQQPQQHRIRKETAELGTRQQQQQLQHRGKGSSSSASADAQPIIIECRKKNSKEESVVTHRFRKGKLLGKGGFAHCYKVTCVDSGRPYAMKIVPKSTLIKSRARQKLQTEIKIHRTLQHPRVVRFEMFFEDRENVYILLELCTNHSLSELIRKTKRFTEDEARRYMLQILEATSYLHRHQIIHRDLKLGNVFLDRDWNIKMGDFGLATKLAQDGERKRTICGTPNYIAPEILEGKAGHSYQVDLWSAGVILYTMLVGRPPYESTDVKSTYRRILANVYAFPDSLTVSDSAKNLVGRLLQVKPELRPSLDEILNHPFLRNGGPRQRFSTSHGLRGSSPSSSPPSSAVTGGTGGTCGVNAFSSSTAGRLGAPQKHHHHHHHHHHHGSGNTPERGAGATGGFGRPPLKARSSNAEAEGNVERLAESNNGRSVKPRAGASASMGGKQGGDAGRDSAPTARHAAHGAPVPVKRSSAGSSSSTAPPSSSRSAVPRSNSTKGFSVYCDVKEASAGGGTGNRSGRSGVGGAHTSRRKDAAAALGSPADKENDPRSALGGSSGNSGVGGIRVPVNGPISRRPIVRSASSVACPSWDRPSARGRPEGSGGGTSGDTKSAVAPAAAAAAGRKATIRRSASAVGATGAQSRVSGRDGGDHRLKAADGRVKTSNNNAGAGAATPRLRPFSARGSITGSPSTTLTYSPYRSPVAASSLNGGGVGGKVSARTIAVGDGTTPRSSSNKPARRGEAQQKLDFGSTPRASRQRASPTAGSSSSGGSGKAIRVAARQSSADAPGAAGSAGTGSRGKASAAAAAAAAAVASLPEEDLSDDQPSRAGGGGGGARGGAKAARKTASVDLERDALESMHEVLATSFASGSTVLAAYGGAPGRSGAARGTRAAAAAAAAAAAEEEASNAAAPPVWVTRYVDYSSKYGLGFLLSDGGAGVYFNDATKIALEPAGVAFEYIERTRRSSPSASERGAAAAASVAVTTTSPGDQPPRARHTLQDFPPELQKKVTLLKHFRGYLNDLAKKGESGADGGGESEGGGVKDGKQQQQQQQQQRRQQQQGKEPLTFLRKWMRTRNAILFRLSNGTVQVVFSDRTEILLSKEGRVVTFVEKDGKRETHSLQRVLEDQRLDITKRVRYANELIGQLLRRV